MRFFVFFWHCFSRPFCLNFRFGFVFRVASGFCRMCLGLWFLQCFLHIRTLFRRCFFRVFLSSLPLNSVCFLHCFFLEKIEKIGSKISSEPDFAVGSTFCSILAHFFRFLANFGGFWEAWGGWGAAFLEFLGLQKREQNLRGFWGAFLRTQGGYSGKASAMLRPLGL